MSAQSASSLPTAGDPEWLFVVDISGYLFRAYHAIPPLSNSRGEPTNAVYGVTSMLLKLVQTHRPHRLAVALDSPEPSFRHELFDAYKANRPEAPPDLSQQMSRVREVVEAYAIPCFEAPGVEADDVIATLVARARTEGLRVVVVSADKDLLQLVGSDVLMYDTMREKVFGALETEQKMGVPPAQVGDLLALMGDSSDNIPGVPSVGAKTAASLLRSFGSIDDLYARLEEVTRKSVRSKLEQHREDALLSRKLVALRDDVDLAWDAQRLEYGGADEEQLRSLFRELEFTRLLNQLKPARLEKIEVEAVLSLKRLQGWIDAATSAEQVAVFFAIEGGDAVGGALIGVGLADGKQTPLYVPVAHQCVGAPEQLPPDAVMQILRASLEAEQVKILSADSKKDTEVCRRFQSIALKAVSVDAMLASYLLDSERGSHRLEELAREELQLELLPYDQVTNKQRGSQMRLCAVEVAQGADYAGRSAAALIPLAERLRTRLQQERLEELMHRVELPLAKVLSRMEHVGIRLDMGRLADLSETVDKQLQDLDSRCTELAGRRFKLTSPRQLETILFDEIELPVIKRTKTARSTDHEVLEELAAHHELPKVILEHRQLSKLKSTYLDALPKQVRSDTGRVHTRYNQAITSTGRISSSEPNLQNIPIRSELGRKIRTAFVPEAGWKMLSADYSQIELRVLAHLSQDQELVDAYSSSQDVHVRTATALFGVSEAQVTRSMRAQAKTVNFAVIYGQTQFALARNLGIERSEAKRYIDAFFERYEGVRRYLDEVVQQAKETGEVRTMMGRRRVLHDLHSRNHNLRMAAERIARNTPIQGTAADIMKVAMVGIDHELRGRRMNARMLLTVHDELVLECPPLECEALGEIVVGHMSGAAKLSVPLEVEAGWGQSWGEAH